MPSDLLALLLLGVVGGGAWAWAMLGMIRSFEKRRDARRSVKHKPPCRDQAKVLYWLNLRQSCALLDKRLRERRGEPTLWSD